ncbi:MAG: MerR family transcriptional regulator [Lachnospiraceae bacterium]|nr:MerR family transcriptional regulator [Lachnospiraceae bacterium]
MENVRYMISDAANIVNVESHVLRYWEEELELQIPRNEMGHRYYTEENIAQFQKIKEWKEQGYQLKAIRMMIHSNVPAGQSPETCQSAGQRQGPENYQNGAIGQKSEAYQNGGMGQRPETYQNGAIGQNMQEAGHLPGNNVIQMNREYGPETKSLAERSNSSAANTVKLEQFQSMMLTIVKRAVEENNQALGKEVGVQVGDRVLKEMNYLMREQDEAEEERFRKLDAAIRTHQKTRRFHREKKEKEGRGRKVLEKDKNLNPNLTV